MAKQGVSLGDLPPYIGNRVRSYMVLGDVGMEWWFGLIDEGEKAADLEDSDVED